MRGDALGLAPIAVATLHPHRVAQVLRVEARDRGLGVEPAARTGLEPRVGVHALGGRGVEPGAAGEDEVAPVGESQVDLPGREAVGQAEQVLGGVDDVVGDAESAGRPRWSSRRAGPRRARRCRRGRSRPRSACRRRRRRRRCRSPPSRASRQISRGVVLRLGRDGLDLVAALERVDDQVLEPVGDRRRVGVDDDQHPLLRRARGRLRRTGRASIRGGGVAVAVLIVRSSP